MTMIDLCHWPVGSPVIVVVLPCLMLVADYVVHVCDCCHAHMYECSLYCYVVALQ